MRTGNTKPRPVPPRGGAHLAVHHGVLPVQDHLPRRRHHQAPLRHGRPPPGTAPRSGFSRRPRPARSQPIAGLAEGTGPRAGQSGGGGAGWRGAGVRPAGAWRGPRRGCGGRRRCCGGRRRRRPGGCGGRWGCGSAAGPAGGAGNGAGNGTGQGNGDRDWDGVRGPGPGAGAGAGGRDQGSGPGSGPGPGAARRPLTTPASRSPAGGARAPRIYTRTGDGGGPGAAGERGLPGPARS